MLNMWNQQWIGKERGQGNFWIDSLLPGRSKEKILTSQSQGRKVKVGLTSFYCIDFIFWLLSKEIIWDFVVVVTAFLKPEYWVSATIIFQTLETFLRALLAYFSLLSDFLLEL